MIPPSEIQNELGEPVPWEACITLNNHWGYSSHDKHWKNTEMIIRMLIDCVSKNGNLLLNVGTDSKGRIPSASIAILEEVGKWIADNGESIYNCGAFEYSKLEQGRFTRSVKDENKIHAHTYNAQTGAVCLPHLAGRIEKLCLLSDRSEIMLCNDYWNLSEYKEHAFFFLNPQTHDSYPLPDPIDTVVEITRKHQYAVTLKSRLRNRSIVS